MQIVKTIKAQSLESAQEICRHWQVGKPPVSNATWHEERFNKYGQELAFHRGAGLLTLRERGRIGFPSHSFWLAYADENQASSVKCRWSSLFLGRPHPLSPVGAAGEYPELLPRQSSRCVFWQPEYFHRRFQIAGHFDLLPVSLEVPPNVPGSVETHFDASKVRSGWSNSQESRKGSLEIREFIAGGGIYPANTGNCRRRGLRSCTGAVILAELEQWGRSNVAADPGRTP